MIIQRVLKGIGGITTQEADLILASGIECNWWRRVHQITAVEIREKLTPRNLECHLDHYTDPDPLENNAPFAENTPFISTTAGTIDRIRRRAMAVFFDPLTTAVEFATDAFTRTGFVFYAYVFTLGKVSIELEEFAEEVRDIHVYTKYSPYYREGEIAAKIGIPAVRIERYEEYDGPAAKRDLAYGVPLRPLRIQANALFQDPEKFCNIRGLLQP